MSDQKEREELLQFHGVWVRDGFSVDALLESNRVTSDGVLPREAVEFLASRGFHHLKAPWLLVCDGVFTILGKKCTGGSSGYYSCVLYIRDEVYHVEDVRNREDAIMGAQAGTWVRTKQFASFEDAWKLFAEGEFEDGYSGILSEADLDRWRATEKK